MLVHGKMLWKLKAMTKVPCFGLGAFMMLVDARQASKGGYNMCAIRYLCKDDGESVYRLLHCRFV